MSRGQGDRLPKTDAPLAGSSRHGRDGQVPAQAGSAASRQRVELAQYEEDLAGRVDWTIDAPRHTIVVHERGRIDRLRTRIAGHTHQFRPPLPGDLWFIPAGERYRATAQGGVIRYSELRVEPLALHEAGARLPLPVRQAHRDEMLYRMVLQLGELAGARDDLSLLLADSLRSSLVLHLARLAASPREPASEREGLDAASRRRLEDYIDAHLDRRIALADLAAVAGLRRHGLPAAFRHSFGATPLQYVIARRLQRACMLLRETRRPIADIAQDCGFFSHSHMTGMFRRHLGVVPSAVRG